jgi:hypothetical protein
MNKVSIEKYPGEIAYSGLLTGEFFHLCNSRGYPMVWIKGQSCSIRLVDGKQSSFGDETILVTRIPAGTEFTFTVSPTIKGT